MYRAPVFGHFGSSSLDRPHGQTFARWTSPIVMRYTVEAHIEDMASFLDNQARLAASMPAVAIEPIGWGDADVDGELRPDPHLRAEMANVQAQLAEINKFASQLRICDDHGRLEVSGRCKPRIVIINATCERAGRQRAWRTWCGCPRGRTGPGGSRRGKCTKCCWRADEWWGLRVAAAAGDTNR